MSLNLLRKVACFICSRFLWAIAPNVFIWWWFHPTSFLHINALRFRKNVGNWVSLIGIRESIQKRNIFQKSLKNRPDQLEQLRNRSTLPCFFPYNKQLLNGKLRLCQRYRRLNVSYTGSSKRDILKVSLLKPFLLREVGEMYTFLQRQATLY